MTDTIERDSDPVERLATYRPTAAAVDAEWSPQRRTRVRDELMAGPPGRSISWRALPRRLPISASVASAAAIVALLIGVLATSVGFDRNSGRDGLPPGGGTPFVAGDVTATPTVGADQFAYYAENEFQTDSSGATIESGHSEVWTAPDGALFMRHTRNAGIDCFHAAAPSEASLAYPTSAFLAQLPTAPDALDADLRTRVDGSSSQDEALFVAAGDTLRNYGLLASSQLRAAWVMMLSHLSRITVHTAMTDERGRAAIRVDFTDTKSRPGEVHSLFFDPSTFELLEERTGSLDGPQHYDGPTPAYTLHPTDEPGTPAQLGAGAYVNVMTEEKVVDGVPDAVVQCAQDSN